MIKEGCENGPNMDHYKISSQSFIDCFFLLIFDRIHDAMCLNKMSRTSSRNIGPQNKKIQQYILLYTWGTFFYLWNTSWVFAAKEQISLFHLTIEASPIWSSSRVWQLNMLEIVFGWVRIIFLETHPNNMWWCRGCLTIFLKVFWPRNSTYLYHSSVVVIGESLATQTVLLAVH